MFVKKTLILYTLSLISFINITIAKQITYKGAVVDSESRPIVGAKVTLYEMWSDGIAGNMYFKEANDITTPKDGTFIISTEPKPEKSTFNWSYVIAAKEDLALGWARWEMREDMKQNITLGEPVIVEGVIVDESGRPVANANVRANLTGTIIEDNGNKNISWLPGIPPFDKLITQTDVQGKFRINNLPSNTSLDLLVITEGKATFYTRLPGPPEEPAYKTGQKDIKVTLPNEARIEGKIIDPDTGEGVAGLKFAVIYTGSGLFFYRFVCETDGNGNFSLGGLLNSEYLIRCTALPYTDVNCTSGQTTNVTIQANKSYYGRITFEDGGSVIIKPAPWDGAETRMFLIVDGKNILNRIDIDEEGYFKVYISQGQYENIQSGNAMFQIDIPEIANTVGMPKVGRIGTFLAADVLSIDKTKAGVIKVPRRWPPSLVGKSLPDFNDIKVNYSIEKVQRKMNLICFFDIEQRPSRNCIIELNKKAQELNKKEIEVILIHASKIEKEHLDNWLKENNISFPVGMIETKEEKTKFNWGVRALPWMILTDKEHVVTDEGFSINELEEKL